ncbi:hypothetical protein B0I00_2503 [Novosphingobium kunmingense]|uniref:Uncharacterized protein n=1 Tax=Novosphingobium kunmingense TaxID=1211806 RepID=A0A2N0H7J0_9SPHN|nr:hypothetical protein [Novosphingobium kunmingense]PKB14901.1 hypothetical protein B0I00_2503 [Novosphingobium kunmingense]
MANQQDQHRAKAPPPITANPLFPAIVALWFAALFGLSSLVVRVSVIESLVRLSKLDLVLHAAAPPLGLTARILVALALAALGALVGAAIARRMARGTASRRESRRSANGADEDEPFVPDAAFLSDPGAPGTPARRPILASEELAGASPLNAAQGTTTPPPLLRRDDVPTDLNAFTDAPEPEPVDLPIVLTVSAPSADDNARAGRQVFGRAPVEPQELAERQIFQPSIDDDMGGQQPEPAPPLADLDMVDLALRLQQAMARRRAAWGGPEPEPTDHAPATLAAGKSPAPATPPADMATELPSMLREINRDDHDADNDERSVVLGTLPHRPVLVPAIEPVSPFVPPSNDAVEAAQDEEDEASAITGQGYASLLEVGSVPTRPTFARAEEAAAEDVPVEPVIIFPGQAARPGFGAPRLKAASAVDTVTPPAQSPNSHGARPSTLDAEETDRSLRAALANLQRIGGAG